MAFNWFKKLKTGLSKSAQKVEKAFTSVIGKKKLDENSLIEIEDQLISSDLGVNASIKIVDKLMKDGIKAYFVQLKDKDPNELGFKKVWDVIHSTNRTSFSDIIRHRLYG